MNKDWFDWTKLNISRGCSPAEIKSILLKNGFSAKDALLAMSSDSFANYQANLNANKASDYTEQNANTNGKTQAPAKVNADAKNTIDFEASANISLLSNPNVEKIDAEGLQLFRLKDFLSREECQSLISVINTQLRPSTITTGEDKNGFRTSSTCDLGDQHSKIVGKVDKKISRVMGIRLPWSEMIQGQKYEVGQEFKAHTDYFEPNSKEFEEFASALGQRTWTFMIYLNQTPAGGHTHFTEINRSFAPVAGTALIWNNLREDGSPNPLTMHHGMPVEQGKKIIITKWFRAKGTGQPFYNK